MSFRVAGIGEVLWDRFPDADRLGGAPANFAFHAAQLGADSHVLSRVGRDKDGDRLLQTLTSHKLATTEIQQNTIHPTGVVRVKITDGQPSYVIESPAAWDHLELTDAWKNLAAGLDAVCFGTLAQRNQVSRQTIQSFLRLCPPTTLRLFDINLRQDYFSRETIEFSLAHATVLKLNDDELPRLFYLLGLPLIDGKRNPATLFNLYPLDLIAVTHGADGSSLHQKVVEKDRRLHRCVRSLAPSVTCVDAVGAGDAFSAALVIGLLKKKPLEEIAAQANQIGAFVASQPGAMPSLPKELLL